MHALHLLKKALHELAEQGFQSPKREENLRLKHIFISF